MSSNDNFSFKAPASNTAKNKSSEPTEEQEETQPFALPSHESAQLRFGHSDDEASSETAAAAESSAREGSAEEGSAGEGSPDERQSQKRASPLSDADDLAEVRKRRLEMEKLHTFDRNALQALRANLLEHVNHVIGTLDNCLAEQQDLFETTGAFAQDAADQFLAKEVEEQAIQAAFNQQLAPSPCMEDAAAPSASSDAPSPS